MTFNEYIVTAGVYSPQTALNTITNPITGVTVYQMFTDIYGERECIWDVATKFSKKLEAFTATIVAHYKPLIAGVDNINGGLGKDLTAIRTMYAAPDGSPDTAYATGMEKVENKYNQNDLKAVSEYITALSVMYAEMLECFEPLFVGVY